MYREKMDHRGGDEEKIEDSGGTLGKFTED